MFSERLCRSCIRPIVKDYFWKKSLKEFAQRKGIIKQFFTRYGGTPFLHQMIKTWTFGSWNLSEAWRHMEMTLLYRLDIRRSGWIGTGTTKTPAFCHLLFQYTHCITCALSYSTCLRICEHVLQCTALTASLPAGYAWQHAHLSPHVSATSVHSWSSTSFFSNGFWWQFILYM